MSFGYQPTDFRFEARWKDGKWDEGESLPTIPILNCPKLPVFFTMHSAVSKAKAYETEKGEIVTFRPEEKRQTYVQYGKAFGNAELPCGEVR